MEMAKLLQRIREVESGNREGRYQQRVVIEGEEYFGAYAIPRSQWKSWSAAAGLKGAPIESPAAQDRVVAHVLNRFYRDTGSWDLAVAGWYGGGSAVRQLRRLNRTKREQLPQQMRKYADAVLQGYEDARPTRKVARLDPWPPPGEKLEEPATQQRDMNTRLVEMVRGMSNAAKGAAGKTTPEGQEAV